MESGFRTTRVDGPVCVPFPRAGLTECICTSTMNELLAAYRYTSNNWAQVEGSTLCGCCSCMQIFRPHEVVAWTGLDMDNVDDPKAVDNQTAMCPRCGSEAVLADKSGYPIDAHFLGRMNEAWFQRTLIRKPQPKK